ncbi:hypothetical protein TSMEX_003616 [Taenia solium]|eukprot:TsM_001038100 transcript=TsM_001038100 gene=TsM_001038100
MLTGHKMRVPSDIFLPSKEVAIDNTLDCVLCQKEGIRKAFNLARQQLQMPYGRQKKYYDKHSRPNAHHKGDLVQIYRPIPPSDTHRKFYHPWSRDPFRIVKVLPPTNYLVRNAELRTQPIAVHHNRIRPYKGAPPVGYENKVYAIVEKTGRRHKQRQPTRATPGTAYKKRGAV